MDTRGNGGPLCPNGHVQVCVTRAAGLRRVCAACVGGAVRTAASRPTTVNDFLARWDGDGELPVLRPAEARAAERLLRAAEELHDEATPAACRRLVKDVAKATGGTAKGVMEWTLDQMTAGLTRMAEAATETTAA